MEPSLRRYTELPHLIDFHQTKELALLNPALWDDRNDSYYIEQFALANGLLIKNLRSLFGRSIRNTLPLENLLSR